MCSALQPPSQRSAAGAWGERVPTSAAFSRLEAGSLIPTRWTDPRSPRVANLHTTSSKILAGGRGLLETSQASTIVRKSWHHGRSHTLLKFGVEAGYWNRHALSDIPSAQYDLEKIHR